ncbi:MAG TPA: DnaJ domain-containing protein [Thermoanaerobaculia bacterium]|jgi:curved DNA-binding protein CbpA|nr:DnaJ domain-containing protein [Thermoanaerobaculia bacterium]
MARDFYAVLAVAKTATDDQIRQRFRQLARERHPDRFSGEEKTRAEQEFQEITQAFNALTDPELRRQHDMDISRRQETPSDPKQVARVYLQRGVRAYKEKNLVEAADNFDRATRSDPASAQAWYNLALTCSQNPGWLARASAAIERACELEPMNPGYWKVAGRILAQAGHPERAAAAYRKAIDWGEDDPAVHRALEELSRSPRRGLFGKSN